MQLFKGEIDFVGRIPVFGAMSALLVVSSLVAVLVFGLNFGIDFAGGYEIQVRFPEAVSETQIRGIVEPLGLGDARVQRFGRVEDNEYLILIREHGTVTETEKTALLAEFQTLAGGAEELRNWSVAESGEKVLVGFNRPVSEAEVRAVIERHKLTIKSVSRGEREDRPEYAIDIVSLADQIESGLRQGLGIAAGTELVQRVEFVGPQVGEELRNQGFMAVLYALIIILLYIAIRFDLAFAPGAVLALFHDVMITVGVFAVLQLEFNLPIIAALLTLVGYSINDTIIVYDRIRENGVRLRGRELRAMVNTSVNQTLSRTILTSSTTLVAVAALLIYGGGVVRDFSIALFVGILVGTYSSIYIASPVFIWLREHWKRAAATRSEPRPDAVV